MSTRENKNQKENEMKIGDKVRTIYGKIETVMEIEPARIITYESAKRNNWYHPTKVFPAPKTYWSNTLKRNVTIPED